MARRDDREYREYLMEEQRRQPGCPARELCREPRGQDTSWFVTPHKLSPNDTHYANAVPRRRRNRRALRAGVRSGRSECEQGLDRGTAETRRRRLVAARRSQAATARRGWEAHHGRRSPGDRFTRAPDAGAESRGGA